MSLALGLEHDLHIDVALQSRPAGRMDLARPDPLPCIAAGGHINGVRRPRRRRIRRYGQFGTRMSTEPLPGTVIAAYPRAVFHGA